MKKVVLLVFLLVPMACSNHVPSVAYGSADVAVKSAAHAVRLCADNPRCVQKLGEDDIEFAAERVRVADAQLDEVEPLLMSPNPEDEDYLMAIVNSAKRVADEVYHWMTEF